MQASVFYQASDEPKVSVEPLNSRLPLDFTFLSILDKKGQQVYLTLDLATLRDLYLKLSARYLEINEAQARELLEAA